MGFGSSRRQTDADVEGGRGPGRQQRRSQRRTAEWSRNVPVEQTERRFGMTVPDHDTALELQRLAAANGERRVRGWVDEGMTTDTMGDPHAIEDFRQRQAQRPPEVPTDVERRNKRSLQRSEQAAGETGPAGDTGTPESVRAVISSSGQSLDGSIQRAMEDRMGDSLGDVRIHTGAQAAKACEDINARAFTVGNHIAFNAGEYDPSSPEGQHVLAHELAHVRQQTGGAVSMLPQDDVQLDIDPDPSLEREAEETAQQVMQGGELGIQRMAATGVHVQRFGGIASSVGGMAQTAYDAFSTNKRIQKDQQRDRAASFESMGGAEGGLEDRVAALEDNVSQLGSYVAEQVGPSPGLRERLSGSVPKEGVKEVLKISSAGLIAAGTAATTKSPEVAIGAGMAAQAGVETLASQAQYAGPMVPDIGETKLGSIKDTVEEIVEKYLGQKSGGADTDSATVGSTRSE